VADVLTASRRSRSRKRQDARAGHLNTATGITAQGDYIFRDSLTEAQVIPQTIAKAKEVQPQEVVVVFAGRRLH
jgi:hypothetical protein